MRQRRCNRPFRPRREAGHASDRQAARRRGIRRSAACRPDTVGCRRHAFGDRAVALAARRRDRDHRQECSNHSPRPLDRPGLPSRRGLAAGGRVRTAQARARHIPNPGRRAVALLRPGWHLAFSRLASSITSRMRRQSMAKPVKFAHVVYMTRRFDEMIAWYQDVFEAEVVYQNPALAFLTYDDEHHRFAFANLDVLKPAGSPQADRGEIGVNHVAYTYGTAGDL